MNSSLNQRRLRLVMIALAATALAAPAAQARHAPGEDPGTTPPPQSLRGAASQGHAQMQWNASPLEIDRLGPKHVPLHHPNATPVSVTKVVKPSGFDWGDAGIGAGVSSLTLGLIAGLALLLTRRSPRQSVPEQRELAGT